MQTLHTTSVLCEISFQHNGCTHGLEWQNVRMRQHNGYIREIQGNRHHGKWGKNIKFKEQWRAATAGRNCEMYLTRVVRDWRNHMLVLNFGTAVSFRDSSNALPWFGCSRNWCRPKLSFPTSDIICSPQKKINLWGSKQCSVKVAMESFSTWQPHPQTIVAHSELLLILNHSVVFD